MKKKLLSYIAVKNKKTNEVLRFHMSEAEWELLKRFREKRDIITLWDQFLIDRKYANNKRTRRYLS